MLLSKFNYYDVRGTALDLKSNSLKFMQLTGNNTQL